MKRKLLPGLAALGLLGIAAAAAPAQPPAPPKLGLPQRQIIRWPGGWMYLDEPGVIYHDDGTKGAPANVISNSGNGIGNTITLDTGDKGGVTILKNVKNGIGNTITVKPDGPVIELPGRPAVPMVPMARPGKPAPAAALVYKGRNTKFWTKKVWSEALDRNLYWDPISKMWLEYDGPTDSYRPLTGRLSPEKP